MLLQLDEDNCDSEELHDTNLIDNSAGDQPKIKEIVKHHLSLNAMKGLETIHFRA